MQKMRRVQQGSVSDILDNGLFRNAIAQRKRNESKRAFFVPLAVETEMGNKKRRIEIGVVVASLCQKDRCGLC